MHSFTYKGVMTSKKTKSRVGTWNALVEAEIEIMKVALAIWNGRISPVFDVARQVLVVDIKSGKIARRQEEGLPGGDPFRQATRISEIAPDVLICGAVSNPMAWTLTAACSVQLIPFVSGSVDDVLAAWLSGTLPHPDLSMPGCRGRMRRCRSHGTMRPSGPGQRRGCSGMGRRTG